MNNAVSLSEGENLPPNVVPTCGPIGILQLLSPLKVALTRSLVTKEATPFCFLASSMNNEVRYLIRLAAFAVVILVLFCTLSPTGFLSTANLSSMAYQLPEFAMLALAIHPTMLTGGIDLSVVSVANLSAIVAALTMRPTPPGTSVAPSA